MVIDREDGTIIIRKAVTDEDLAVAYEDLAAAYEEHAERARNVNDEWKHASSEANDEL